MSIKWKDLQDDLPLHGEHGASRYSKRVQDATVCHVYDLSSDPLGDSNLSYRDLTRGWMLAPAFKLIGRDSF
jgi:hypothetical protein